MATSLEGKSAIVTGAGGGINFEFAKKLLEAGVNVLIADLALLPEAEKLIEQYQDRPKAVFQKTNVISWPELENMFRTAKSHFNTIDIVCPGAGIFEPQWSNFWYPPGKEPSKDDPASGRYQLLDINVTHPIRTAQMAISHYLESQCSASNPKWIIFIASIAGEFSALSTPLYHASKHAIMGFLRSLSALDQFHGIKVGGVCPGIVWSRLWSLDEQKMLLVTEKDTGKVQESWIMPDEVADAMMALIQKTEVEDGKGGKIAIEGGTVLEVAKGTLRNVPMLGNAGPPLGIPGMIISNMEAGYATAFGELQKPGWGQI